MQSIWKISEDLAELNRFKAFNKKHPREYAACFSNLEQVEATLNRHGAVGAEKLGFFRSEGENVYRIGQTGLKHAVETRLYVYVYAVGHTIYVLTIGDKKQQSDDIRRCKDIVRKFEKGVSNEPERYERGDVGGRPGG